MQIIVKRKQFRMLQFTKRIVLQGSPHIYTEVAR